MYFSHYDLQQTQPRPYRTIKPLHASNHRPAACPNNHTQELAPRHSIQDERSNRHNQPRCRDPRRSHSNAWRGPGCYQSRSERFESEGLVKHPRPYPPQPLYSLHNAIITWQCPSPNYPPFHQHQLSPSHIPLTNPFPGKYLSGATAP